MKKIISLLLVVALTATVAIGGTLAYLTDRDSEVNTFTLGNVSIDLNEEFEQGAELVPGVRIEKEAKITNTGVNDAYVWMTVAVPAVLDDENTELGSANVLHWNMPGCFWNGYHDDEKYIESGIKDGYLPEGSKGVADEDSWINDNKAVKATIDGIEYNVYTFKYVGAIVPGETTNIGLSKVFLDENLDIDTDGQWYIVENGTATKVNWNSNTNGTPIVYVSAYAMQADGFADVKAAYNAYQTQWGNNGTEYAPAEDPTEPADPNATGSITPGYTSADAIWGEGSGSAKNSLVVKVYSGDTYMGSTSLNNVGGIIDGDVYVSWSIKLDAESNTDEYWTMKWENAPTIDLQPTKVEMWIDGTKVAESAVKLSAPDDLKPITGAVTDANGKILRYVVEGTDANVQDGEKYVALP